MKPRKVEFPGLRFGSVAAGSGLDVVFGGMGGFAGRTKAQLLGAYTNAALSSQKLCFSVSLSSAFAR